MSLEQFVEKILEMKERHVCIYGYGKNGRDTVSFLEKVGIQIEAVCDRNSNVSTDKYESVSITQLLKLDEKIICIITPAQHVEKEYGILKEHFITVVGFEWLDFVKKSRDVYRKRTKNGLGSAFIH